MEKTEFGMNISTLEDELERIREKESELINKISELKSKEIGQDANEFFESVKGKNIHIAKDKEHAWIFNVDGLEITDGGKYFVCGKGINVSAYEDLVYLSGCPMPDNTLTKAWSHAMANSGDYTNLGIFDDPRDLMTNFLIFLDKRLGTNVF